MERDWKKINNRLVRHGTLLVSLDFLDNWKKQVKELNFGKVGAPFKYPTGLIEYGGLLHCYLRLGYRQVKGILIGISKKEPRVKVIDYSNLCRRFNKLETKIQPKKSCEATQDFFIAIDSSGQSVTNRGEWMRKIHRKGKITECKGFIKIHVAVDVKTKEVVCMEITREDIGDNAKFDDVLKGSIENTGRKIDGVYADGGYDSYDNFEKLEDLGIEPIIRIDDNAITTPPPDNTMVCRNFLFRVGQKIRDICHGQKMGKYATRTVLQSTTLQPTTVKPTNSDKLKKTPSKIS
jgi:hypothetical protein